MPYPVAVIVAPPLGERSRVTTAFRVVLAIPHIILVGGLSLGYVADDARLRVTSEGGLIGAVAYLLAIVSWVTLVFAGTQIPAIRQFNAFYLRWRVRALSYLLLLTDMYPPFGDAPYPAGIAIEDPAEPRHRLTILFRLFLVIPHLIALVFVVFAASIVAIIAWFAILFTGDYPTGLYGFSVGALRWLLRVESYMLLMVDEYPPFSLD